MNTTPRTDADKACDAVDTLASQCKLNPTAYQREAKEAIRQLETELQEAQSRWERWKQEHWDNKKQQWLNSVATVCSDFPNVAAYIGQLEQERDQLRQQLAEAQAAIVVKDERIKEALPLTDSICVSGLLNEALQPNCGQPLLEMVKEMMKGLEVAKQLADHAQDCDCVICKALNKAKEIGL